MKERPILFSTPMVQAILQRRKTMTRRIIKPQPNEGGVSFMKNPPLDWEQIYRDEWKPYKWDNGEGETIAKHPPYGYPGDRLWVRETWCKLVPEHFITTNYVYKADSNADTEEIRREYIRCGYPYQWKPSIFMPYAASRITLEIVSVKVERLQDISEHDAKNEGVERLGSYLWKSYNTAPGDPLVNELSNPVSSFESLWRKINGNESWASNPWVWVIEFKVL